MKRLFTSTLLAVAACVIMAAQTPDMPSLRSEFISEKVFGANKIKLDSLSDRNPYLNEKVIVKGDTVSLILPDKNYGRYDRGLFNYLIIPKGQWQMGITASYGEFSTDDVQLLSALKNLDMKVKAYSVSPSIAYFFKNNQSIGIKLNYINQRFNLDNLKVDFDDDLNFSVRDVVYKSHTYSILVNYRNYIGLGPQKRFAIFNEVALGCGSGTARFSRLYNDEPRTTRTNTFTANLNFSPGVCIFIMDYVSFDVSFGVFGLNLRHERQSTNGVNEGSRFASGANFKFNIFNINFGVSVVI